MRVLERWPDGAPSVVLKEPAKPKPGLQAREVVRDEHGDLWEVQYVSPASASMKCLAGTKVHKVEEWSVNSIVPRVPRKGRADLLHERKAAVDRKRCRNCWPGLEGEDEPRKDRDPRCRNHVVKRSKRGQKAKGPEDPWKAVRSQLRRLGHKLPSKGKGHMSRLRRLAAASKIEVPE